ncbi:MAG TPA: hypothetical protein EYN51_09545 [Flavobacteriales bacterium]|nr:hypothetical protein [Flavobacteriales bacterium]
MSDTNITDYYPETPEPKSEVPEVPEVPVPETDDFSVDLPDIPLPDMEEDFDAAIKDAFTQDVGFNFCIVGVGQGGSRLAETFWNLGYRRVGVINTAIQDLTPIKLPDENKLLIGNSGAGKNTEVAEEVFKVKYEDILDFLKRIFGTKYERVLVCAGAGGGTGAGGIATVLEVCHDLNQSLGIEVKDTDAKVGGILALPTRGEGIRVQNNAKKTVSKLVGLSQAGVVSPLIILDNEKIKQLYPKLSVNQFWGTANNSICSLFHLFNTICEKQSAYTTFDKADLETIFASGIITFGATPIKDTTATGISYAIRDNLRKNILAGVDVSTGNIAACVIIGDKESLDNIPQDNLEHGFEQLSRIMGKSSTVHRGIYSHKKPGLVAYTSIGGLTAPDNLFDYFFKVDRVYK